ncbi:hypothetical protein JQ582_40950 [Bradyrhizobium japonicum]|uniref:hypothetical protein n=1 Tax=Bradyrhizobium japonicum TaxID=375 RepID=UPI001BA6EC8F|nr:hypothetical protein [Bradyrhizobium japonicum]MBR0750287.1 hypothetical protein [Bradyrhizobium japonicum]
MHGIFQRLHETSKRQGRTARVGTRNFDWSKDDNWFRSLSADAAGGIPRYSITRRGDNNDRLSVLWREVITFAGVARSY